MALQQHGTLNPRPQDVRHPLFQDSDFFDPSDLLQVKYEMLRQVHVDKRAVSRTANNLGVPVREFLFAGHSIIGRKLGDWTPPSAAMPVEHRRDRSSTVTPY